MAREHLDEFLGCSDSCCEFHSLRMRSGRILGLWTNAALQEEWLGTLDCLALRAINTMSCGVAGVAQDGTGRRFHDVVRASASGCHCMLHTQDSEPA